VAFRVGRSKAFLRRRKEIDTVRGGVEGGGVQAQGQEHSTKTQQTSYRNSITLLPLTYYILAWQSQHSSIATGVRSQFISKSAHNTQNHAQKNSSYEKIHLQRTTPRKYANAFEKRPCFRSTILSLAIHPNSCTPSQTHRFLKYSQESAIPPQHDLLSQLLQDAKIVNRKCVTFEFCRFSFRLQMNPVT